MFQIPDCNANFFFKFGFDFAGKFIPVQVQPFAHANIFAKLKPYAKVLKHQNKGTQISYNHRKNKNKKSHNTVLLTEIH